MVNMGGQGGGAFSSFASHFGGTVLLGAAGGSEGRPQNGGQIGKYANFDQLLFNITSLVNSVVN